MAQVLEMGSLLVSDLIRRAHPELEGSKDAFQSGAHVRSQIESIAQQV